MPRDRENLRRRVDQLEATVNGLTQELVEANERLRQLEADESGDSEADKPMPPTDEESNEATETATEEQEPEDDIIVA